MNSENPILLFDGVCNLCSGTVQFAIQRDPKKIFRFASLQSEAGQKLLEQYGQPTEDFKSFILLQDGKVYTRSGAALRFLGRLSGAWPLMKIFLIVPPFIRNWVYDFVARNRYRWYGKKDACWIPTPDLKSRFLE